MRVNMYFEEFSGISDQIFDSSTVTSCFSSNVDDFDSIHSHYTSEYKLFDISGRFQVVSENRSNP